MSLYVVDFETNSLTHSTEIWAMAIGWQDEDKEWQVASTADPEHITAIITDKDNTIVGHNFKMFDKPQVERVLGVEFKAKVIDTLPLAWYAMPRRKKFGLEVFGEKYGIKKVEINSDEWAGPLPGESRKDFDKKMRKRCEEDVKINIKLWEDLLDILAELYGSVEKAQPIIEYLNFKMDCLAHQQESRVRIDMERVYDNINYLRPLIKQKERILINAMPKGKVLKTKPKTTETRKIYERPKTWKRKDGSISTTGLNWGFKVAEHIHQGKHMTDEQLMEYATEEGVHVEAFEEVKLTHYGKKWYDELKELGLDEETEVIYEEPNPHSHDQLKKWLTDLGWQPITFKDGANGPVPQIRDEEKNLCKSVLMLSEKEPAIEALDGLTVLSHRLGILEAFVSEANYNSEVIAGASGFTNTLRLKHVKPIVNLPKVLSKDYIPIEERNLRDGRSVRECIIAQDGHVLCGSDISSLEDQTKRHYMWDYDKQYVLDQMEEGYDPHLDLAVRAGALTEEQVEEHKLYKSTKGKEGKDHSPTRHLYKTANYSCIYGVGVTTLSKSTGLGRRAAEKLRNDYWKRNWSIKAMVQDLIVKKTDEGSQMWILNPVNHFWYSVRNEKDFFSTLNQGTGSFVFDLWVSYTISEGYIPILQYHDELLLNVKKGDEDNCRKALKKSIQKVNELLGLNVTIEVDVEFGKNYADVH